MKNKERKTQTKAVDTNHSADLQLLGRKLFDRSRHQAKTLEKTISEFQEVKNTIENQKNIALKHVEASNLAQRKHEQSRERISGLSEIFDSMNKFQENLSSIGTLINRIKGQLENLEDISIKSEKLSYNAEIEAARSGEDSERFSVIAQEIRKLTDLSRKSTGDISAIVEESVGTVFKYAQETKHRSQSGFELVNDVSASFDIVTTQFEGFARTSEELFASSEGQLSVIGEINNTIKTEVESYSRIVSELLEDLTGISVKVISVDKAHEQIHKLTIIDVRETAEYCDELGHIENSIHIPISGNFEKQMNELDRSGNFLMVCRSDGRSARASRVAQGMGFKNIYNMKGGMLAWCKNGHPSVMKHGTQHNKVSELSKDTNSKGLTEMKHVD